MFEIPIHGGRCGYVATINPHASLLFAAILDLNICRDASASATYETYATLTFSLPHLQQRCTETNVGKNRCLNSSYSSFGHIQRGILFSNDSRV